MLPEQAVGILKFLMPSIEQEHATTSKVFQAVPETAASYRPDEKSMSTLDLMWHIAASEQMFMGGVADGAFPMPSPRPEPMNTPGAILAWYKEQSAANHARLQKMTGEELARGIDFRGRLTLPAVAYLNLMLRHSSHHRGQLSMHFRPMGAPVPAIYGRSADEDPFAAAQAKP